MSTVTIPVALGGSGTTWSDSTDANGMQGPTGYGYKTNMIPMLSDIVAVGNSALSSVNSLVGQSGGAQWVTGTTYGLGAVVWSPSTYQTFRKKTASSVSNTDPASDATNWVQITLGNPVPGALSVTGAVSSALSFTTTGTGLGSPAFYQNGTVNAAFGLAYGMLSRGTLAATANSDVLSALESSAGVVAVGANTGITFYGMAALGAGWTKTGAGSILNAFGLYASAPVIGTNNYAGYFAGNVVFTADIAGPNITTSTNVIAEVNANGVAEIALNYWGYQKGTTQFRNTSIYDGKNTLLFRATGSTGGVQVTGALTFGPGSAVLTTDAANIAALRNGTAAQTLRAYTSYTDASNNELFAINTAAGVTTLATESIGTGSANIDLALSAKGTGRVKIITGMTANGAVATAMSSVGPTGSSTTIQEWLAIKNSAGTVRYIPCF